MDGGDEARDRAKPRTRWRWAWWVVGIACLLGLGVLWRQLWLRHQDDECTQNANIARTAIWYYATQQDRLPTAAELADFFDHPPGDYWFLSDYDRPLKNPYNRGEVAYVDFADPAPGDFTFIPIPSEEFAQYGPQFADRYGYYLIVWGRDPAGGKDLDGDGEGDGALLVLSSADDCGCGASGPIWVGGLFAPPDNLDTVHKAIQWAERVKK